MRSDFNIGIIGAGRVGSNIAYHLAKAGWHIKSVYSRTKRSAEKLAKEIPTGAVDTIEDVARKCDIVFITTPDEQIIPVAEEISELSCVRVKMLVHCAGIFSSSILAAAGMEILKASMHPFASIPPLAKDKNPYRGIVFACEGDAEAMKIVEKMVSDIGGIFFKIDKKVKTLYHSAAVFGANFIFVLAYITQTLLERADMDKNMSHYATTMLMKRALDNYEKIGIPVGITGPIARKDRMVVEAHIDALKDTEFFQYYIDLSRMLIKMLDIEKEFDLDMMIEKL